MSKKKTAKPKSSGPHATPTAAETAVEPAALPVGQLLFDMPYSGSAPRLIKPDLGLYNLVARAGHNAGYTIDVTLLDAPDHRLIRSGVLLAHRVLDGRGEWYLGAPQWVPVLPDERIEPMGQGDLPQQLAELVRPFRRRATLGPVAALTCERREFALRNDRGTTLALVRDDKVTVRRGGLTTARFREVMLTPAGPGLTHDQAAHLHRQLSGAGGTQVARFPKLVNRLGAPATGPTDFPRLEGVGQQPHFAQFVSALLGTRLRQMLEADLAYGDGDLDAAAHLRDHSRRLLTELSGLKAVLDPDWTDDLHEELTWLAGQAERELARGPKDAAVLAGPLRGERYLTLMDRLVTATRSPKVGGSSTLGTAEVVERLLDSATHRLRASVDGLQADGDPASWESAAAALSELSDGCVVAAHVLPERAETLQRRLAPARELLAEATAHWRRAEEVRTGALEATPAEAFDLGRTYEHELAVVHRARESFVRVWTKTARKLSR